jgi:putative hydrolase of the HAD superfamily
MPRDARAIIFDLDDTLYPLRRFVRSGFVAVSAELERGYGIDSRKALKVLTAAMRGETCGRELQVCIDRFRLPEAIVSDLVNIIRLHQPAIRLPRVSIDAIEKLRGRWRIGVLTNGLPDLQARKVESLGLRFLVDAVVYANAVGNGRGKPALEPFQDISRKLGVPAVRTVFVGNDDRTDVLGAACAGMRTIHVGGQSCYADAIAESMADVPSLAEQLVTEDWSFDVA